MSEQSGPLAANWNTKFPFMLAKRNNWFLLYPFRNKRSSFISSDFPYYSKKHSWYYYFDEKPDSVQKKNRLMAKQTIIQPLIRRLRAK